MNSRTQRGATMADSILNTKREAGFKDLPPGFRFYPTDEELITHYLSEKAMNPGFTSRAIGDVNFNKCEPWDLPIMARIGEKEKGLYFFCQRDRKYPCGMRTNRATEAGYWKATGKDREIYKDGSKVLVGMKKTLVFYLGRAPRGEKTNWIMHEYRLEGQSKGSWVVSRVFQRKSENKKSNLNTFGSDLSCMMNPEQGQHQSLNSNRQHEQEKLRAPSHLRQSPVQSIVTALQEAVFSPEANTETSSIVPKNESSSYQPFNYDLQAGSFEDLDSIYWNL